MVIVTKEFDFKTLGIWFDLVRCYDPEGVLKIIPTCVREFHEDENRLKELVEERYHRLESAYELYTLGDNSRELVKSHYGLGLASAEDFLVICKNEDFEKPLVRYRADDYNKIKERYEVQISTTTEIKPVVSTTTTMWLPTKQAALSAMTIFGGDWSKATEYADTNFRREMHITDSETNKRIISINIDTTKENI